MNEDSPTPEAVASPGPEKTGRPKFWTFEQRAAEKAAANSPEPVGPTPVVSEPAPAESTYIPPKGSNILERLRGVLPFRRSSETTVPEDAAPPAMPPAPEIDTPVLAPSPAAEAALEPAPEIAAAGSGNSSDKPKKFRSLDEIRADVAAAKAANSVEQPSPVIEAPVTPAEAPQPVKAPTPADPSLTREVPIPNPEAPKSEDNSFPAKEMIKDLFARFPFGVKDREKVEDPKEQEAVAADVEKKVEGRTIFGQPMGKFIRERGEEMLVGGVAGWVAKTATREGILNVAQASVEASLGPIAGAVGGAAAGGAREILKERRSYNTFIKEVVGDGELTVELFTAKYRELKEDLSKETSAHKKEEAKDKLRYLQVALKREEDKKEQLRNQEEANEIREKIKATVDKEERRKLEEGLKELEKVRASRLKRQSYLLTTTNAIVDLWQKDLDSPEGEKEKLVADLLKEIKSSKVVDRKRVLKAVGRGALFGAIGGSVGASVAEWMQGHIDLEGLKQMLPKLSIGAGITLPPTGLPGSEAVSPPVDAVPGPEVPGGTTPTTELPDNTPAAPETEVSAEVIKLPSGGNPWTQAASYAKTALGREPTNAEILEITKAIAKESGIKVPEWGLTEGLDQRALPAGFELKISPATIALIKGFAKGGS